MNRLQPNGINGMNCKGCLVSLLALVGLGIVAVSVATLSLGRMLDATSQPTPADAIFVLGGEGGQFTRTRHALDLYDAGLAPKVVFSGGTLLGAGLACTSTELSLEAAQQLGLPAEAIVLADEAQSTLDEAENLARLADEQGWRSLILVTDRFHTRRALRTMQAMMPDVRMAISAPMDPQYDPAHWWGTEHGLIFAVNEALKLGFYWAEYGIKPFG